MTHRPITVEEFVSAYNKALVNDIQDLMHTYGTAHGVSKFSCMSSLMVLIALGLLDDDEVTRDSFIEGMPTTTRLLIAALRHCTKKRDPSSS